MCKNEQKQTDEMGKKSHTTHTHTHPTYSILLLGFDICGALFQSY